MVVLAWVSCPVGRGGSSSPPAACGWWAGGPFLGPGSGQSPPPLVPARCRFGPGGVPRLCVCVSPAVPAADAARLWGPVALGRSRLPPRRLRRAGSRFRPWSAGWVRLPRSRAATLLFLTCPSVADCLFVFSWVLGASLVSARGPRSDLTSFSRPFMLVCSVVLSWPLCFFKYDG